MNNFVPYWGTSDRQFGRYAPTYEERQARQARLAQEILKAAEAMRVSMYEENLKMLVEELHHWKHKAEELGDQVKEWRRRAKSGAQGWKIEELQNDLKQWRLKAEEANSHAHYWKELYASHEPRWWERHCELKRQLDKYQEKIEGEEKAVQAVVEVRTCAVEAPVPAEVCESACQTFSPHGNGHGCCEKAVQTANSFIKPASGVCWRCGKHGHFRKHCRNKGRRRRFARKKAENLRQACSSTNQGGSQSGQAVWVLTVSDVGGTHWMGGQAAEADAATRPTAPLHLHNPMLPWKRSFPW